MSRKLLSIAAGGLLLLELAASAHASVISFTGNTTAAINPTASAGVGFTGTTINTTTDASGNSGAFSLGSISATDLTKDGFSALQDGVTLNLNITGGIFAGTVVPLTFDLWGRWNGFFGNLDIWGDLVTPQLITFSNSAGSGSFYLSLVGTPTGFVSELAPDTGPHMFYTPGNSILAQITNATFTPAPEPASLAILGSGLTAIGLIRRRHTQ